MASSVVGMSCSFIMGPSRLDILALASGPSRGIRSPEGRAERGIPHRRDIHIWANRSRRGIPNSLGIHRPAVRNPDNRSQEVRGWVSEIGARWGWRCISDSPKYPGCPSDRCSEGGSRPATRRCPNISTRGRSPKTTSKSRAGRDHRGLCRPRGPTPRWRSRRALFGSFSLSCSSTQPNRQPITDTSHPFSQGIQRFGSASGRASSGLENCLAEPVRGDLVRIVNSSSDANTAHQGALEWFTGPSDLWADWAILNVGEVTKLGSALRATKARRDLRSRCRRLQPADGAR